jgi:hypothetical protein
MVIHILGFTKQTFYDGMRVKSTRNCEHIGSKSNRSKEVRKERFCNTYIIRYKMKRTSETHLLEPYRISKISI